MSRKKRTRTTSIDGLPARNVRRMRQVRRQVAAEAARIMSTEGLYNYRAAKRKAAARIGINSRLAMPANKEIEQALRAYQDCYGGEQHIRQLEILRKTAVKVMRALESFCPRLVGPVLEGTADQHSRVSLHLFNDSPDEVLTYLGGKGLSYRQEERKIRWHDGSHRLIPLVITDADGITVELSLFSSIDLRQAPPSPVDGRPQKRAPLTEVECLLAG